jgi:hypothetical protein
VAFSRHMKHMWVLCLALTAFVAQAVVVPPCTGAWGEGAAEDQICATACCRSEAREGGAVCPDQLCSNCSPVVCAFPAPLSVLPAQVSGPIDTPPVAPLPPREPPSPIPIVS